MLWQFVTSIDEKYEDGKALLNLAKSYEKAGKTEQAKTTYKRVAELYPNSDLANQAAGINRNCHKRRG